MTIEINKIGSGEIYLQIMKLICGDVSDKSVVDLMCYHSPYIPQMGFKKRTYVDIQDRKLDDKREQQFFVLSDVFDYLAHNKEVVDIMISSDGIEHLTSDKGLELISLMKQRSDCQVLFTPLGENMVDKNAIHPDTHKSGWTPEIINYHFPDYFSFIVMPRFHTSFGAFFFWHNKDNYTSQKINESLKSIQW